MSGYRQKRVDSAGRVHGKRRGRVPQFVRREAREPDCRRRTIEPADPEDVVPQPGARANAVEHRGIGRASGDLRAQ